METKELKFKTNINCSGCINAVKPHLDNATGIAEWNVDTGDADKILTVTTDSISEEDVIQIIQKAGYKIEVIGK